MKYSFQKVEPESEKASSSNYQFPRNTEDWEHEPHADVVSETKNLENLTEQMTKLLQQINCNLKKKKEGYYKLKEILKELQNTSSKN